MIDDPERLLARLEPARPDAALRARVIREARRALAEPEAPDLFTRIWESRAIRLAWSASVAALLLAHVAVTRPRTAAPIARKKAILPVRPDRELAAIATLPRIDTGTLPLVREWGGAGQKKKEKAS